MKEEKKKFMPDIDYNNSATACPACLGECEKINKSVNSRKLSEIEEKEIPHLLKVFNF